MAPPTGADLGVRRRLGLLLASSRTLQAHLSIAQPAIGALLAASAIPSGRIVALGLVASWCGLHAVFAINDLLDTDLDRRRFEHLKGYTGFDVDTVIARHPVAQGALPRRELALWVLANSLAATFAAWALHPVTVAIFAASVSLELLYCRLATRTPLKFVVTGVMVALGASAGWFAVSRRAGVTFAVFAAWMAAWEIGGRNIVNDWSDVEEDVRLGIRTVPVVLGQRVASILIVASLCIAAALGMLVVLPARLGPVAAVGASLAGVVLLVAPAVRLARNRGSAAAHSLFNRASLYPPAMLAVIGLDLLLRGRT